MLACFATDTERPADILVDDRLEPMPEAGLVEHELAYTENSVRFQADRVQVVRDAEQWRIHGPGELLTSVVPVLDAAMVGRGAGMIHAATMAYRGHAIALPAAGGTGKTSTAAKLMRREGWSFMGDDWAFLAEDATLLGYAKPMFIKPHHRAIYPHLFEGVRKPLVPSRLSRERRPTHHGGAPVRYPLSAPCGLLPAMVAGAPHGRPGDRVPGAGSHHLGPARGRRLRRTLRGRRSRIVERTSDWMVDRMIGNFHIEMAGFSQQVVTGLAATSVLPWREHFAAKGVVLSKALDGRPCHLLQVPSAFSADEASDDIVRYLDQLLPSVLDEQI